MVIPADPVCLRYVRVGVLGIFSGNGLEAVLRTPDLFPLPIPRPGFYYTLNMLYTF